LEDVQVCDLFMVLIVGEENWTGLVACGFVRDMLTLGETLPFEVVLWSLEHSIPVDNICLTIVAFEKSQTVAYAFSEVVIAAQVCRCVTHLLTAAPF
jgi:hypothetical protein